MRRAAGAAAAREPGFAAPAAPAGGCHPASRARAGHERGARQAFRISVTGAGGALASLAMLVAPAGVPAAGTATLRLAVPLVRQAPERCGPAALRMVLGFYHADSAALAAADSAYDPVLRGSLVTDLARRARGAGFAARVTSGDADSLIAWLERGVPPIILYPSGIGPLTRMHYAVVVGWDPREEAFVLHDGGRRPRGVSRRTLERRRAPADQRVLLVGRPEPGS